MKKSILATGKDVEAFRQEQAAWQNHGITAVRAGSMQEAIEELSKKEFCFVVINTDTINYIPLLRIMNERTSAHIFILDSNHTYEKQIEAYNNGATWYAQLYDNPGKNVQAVLSYFQTLAGRSRQQKRSTRTLVCGNLTVFPDHHQVFCNDVEIAFTPKEYKLLCYLLQNRNNTLKHKQIACKVWDNEAVSDNAIWQVVNRLCKKLDDSGILGGSIINFRGVGYRFITKAPAMNDII